jgi:hypothetical protein
MAKKVFLEWENVNFTWDNLDMLWEDVSILIEVAEAIKRGGGGLSEYVRNNPWDVTKRQIGEEKTKKFIKIFCRVNDLDFEEVTEPNSKVKVTVEQMEKTFNESLKIGVKIDFKNNI